MDEIHKSIKILPKHCYLEYTNCSIAQNIFRKLLNKSMLSRLKAHNSKHQISLYKDIFFH